MQIDSEARMPGFPLTCAAFGGLDWVVLGGYFAVLAVTGWWLSLKKQQGTDDYFLAGHGMPTWAVAFSVVATALSAATFIGAPEASYNGDLTYLSSNIGVVVAVVIVAVLFIPAFYRHRVTTVYELLEDRIGPRAKLAASWMFMVGRVFASGSRIFIAAIPAALILFGPDAGALHLVCAIAALTVVGVAYTLVGGIRSVIWSDVIQLFVFVGAAIAAMFVLLDRIPIGVGEMVHVLSNPVPDDPEAASKLTVLKVGVDEAQPMGIDWSSDFTLITALTGLVVLNVAAYATDQDLAQRMLTCRNAVKGSASVVWSLALNIPITALFLLVGLLLYIYYQRPDVMGDAAPTYEMVRSQKVFANFILHEMPVGLKGLLMAGLFAAGLSSLNSALNAMSSAFVSDFYRQWRHGRDERHYLLVGRIAVLAWGVILGSFACLCVYWHRASGGDLIAFALMVMVFAYAGLVAVFVIVIFTRRGSEASVIAALIVGFVTVLLLNWQPWVGEDGAGTLSLGFPWKMLIASGLAFGVACMGRRSAEQPTASPATEASTPGDAIGATSPAPALPYAHESNA